MKQKKTNINKGQSLKQSQSKAFLSIYIYKSQFNSSMFRDTIVTWLLQDTELEISCCLLKHYLGLQTLINDNSKQLLNGAKFRMQETVLCCISGDKPSQSAEF